VPDLSHLWQRFVLAAALVLGLALGVAATVFGYSNTNTVSVGFSIYRLEAVPLWTVAIVPLVLFLAAGTLYHWWNSLHHFTEHMRHRRRVKELEAEVTSLKARLDSLLEMPDQATTAPAAMTAPIVETIPVEAVEPTLEPEPLPAEAAVTSNGDDEAAKKGRKRLTEPETETVAVAADGSSETEPRAETPPGA
jgi:hypothetical protein